MPPDDQATTPALFLAGKGNLTRDFTASLVDAAGRAARREPGAEARAQRRRSRTTIGWCSSVDPATLGLRGLVTVDAQGGTSSFSFTNLKENVGLADKEFAFKIPRGVDVVTDSPAR